MDIAGTVTKSLFAHHRLVQDALLQAAGGLQAEGAQGFERETQW